MNAFYFYSFLVFIYFFSILTLTLINKEQDTMKTLDLPFLSDKPKHDLHFNYTLQVWVKDGIIEDCHHPKCRDNFKTSCNSHKYHEDSETDAMNHYNNTRP